MKIKEKKMNNSMCRMKQMHAQYSFHLLGNRINDKKL